MDEAVIGAGELAERLIDLVDDLEGRATVEAVAEHLVREVAHVLGGDGCVLALASATTAQVIATVGYRADRVAAFELMTVDSILPITDAIRLRRPVWISTRADLDRCYPLVGAARDAHSSVGVVPFKISDGRSGALAVSYVLDRELGGEQRTFLVAAAQLCGQILGRLVYERVPWTRVLDLVGPYGDLAVFDADGAELFTADSADASMASFVGDRDVVGPVVDAVIASGRAQRASIDDGQDGAEQRHYIALPLLGEHENVLAVVVRPEHRR